MENRKKITRILSIPLVIFLPSVILQFLPYEIKREFGWSRDFISIISNISLIGFVNSIIFILFSSILYFRPDPVFLSWWKFAKRYLTVVSVLLAYIILSDSSGSHWGVSSGLGDPESVIWFTSALFFLISLIIIISKSLQLRRQGK